VLVRSDVETLLLPVLGALYGASRAHANHLYMLQVCVGGRGGGGVVRGWYGWCGWICVAGEGERRGVRERKAAGWWQLHLSRTQPWLTAAAVLNLLPILPNPPTPTPTHPHTPTPPP